MAKIWKKIPNKVILYNKNAQNIVKTNKVYTMFINYIHKVHTFLEQKVYNAYAILINGGLRI